MASTSLTSDHTDPQDAGLSDDEIRRWIVAHRVCWEAVKHFEYREGQKLTTGMDLELFAWVPGEDDPGSPTCEAARIRLREIALRGVPEGARYAFGPASASFYLRPEADHLPMVRVAIEVRHAHGTFEPLDQAERSALHTVEQRLLDLGVQERTWRRRGV